MFDTYGVDGVMIGRASVGKPWLFNHIKHYIRTGELLPEPLLEDKVSLAIEQLKMSIQWKGEKVGILEMRRHLSNYFKGLPHFRETRMRLLTSASPNEVFDILEEIRNRYRGLQFEGENDYFRY